MIDLHLSRSLFNATYFPYLFDYSKRYEVYYGGAGSGKSVFIGQKLIIKALNDKRKVLVIRKAQTTQRESCWRLILSILSKWKIYSQCKINKSDFSIELPNGSVFLFKGLDDSEKIKSIVDLTDIWCEEATELYEEDYDQLDLRLRALAENLQIFLSFNPVSKANWVYLRWLDENADYDKESTFILKTTYKDNHFLPKEYIRKLEKLVDTNPTYHKIYVLGEFCSIDKLVYTNWEIKDEDFKKYKSKQLLVGLDFGFINDPSAIVVAWLVESEKLLYIFKEWGEVHKTNPELANVIRGLGLSKEVIIADSAEHKSIEEIRRLGINRIKPAEKGPDSVIHGIQQLQQYHIIVHPSCTGTITELENYSWIKDKKTGEYTNKPADSFNHYLDALRYSMQCVRNKIRVIDKSLLGL